MKCQFTDGANFWESVFMVGPDENISVFRPAVKVHEAISENTSLKAGTASKNS